MTRDPRPSLAVALALAFSAGAQAQVASTDVVSPALQVELLAPQLQAFAGSAANFSSLVSGLAQGAQVTLTSPTADGFTEVVTFTPSGTMTATAVAQTLESVRQSLISRGIASPSASQIAAALVGGNLQTTSGPVAVNGLLPPTGISAPTNVSTSTLNLNGPANAGIVTAPDGSVIGSVQPRVNTSDSPLLRNTSDSPARGLNPLPNAVISPPLVGAPLTPSTPPALANTPRGATVPGGFIVRPRR